MSKETLQELLSRLHGALRTATPLDVDTLAQLRELDTDIKKILRPASTANNIESITKRATALESHFAVNHPVAEKIIREIISTLERIGI